MNNSILFLPSICIGGALLIVYFYRCWKFKQPINVGHIINFILQASGVVAGALLILSTFSDEVRKRTSEVDLNLYMCIAGISVLFVSILAIKKDLFDNNNNSNSE